MTEFLADVVPEGGTVGFDGRVLAMGEGQELKRPLLRRTSRSAIPKTLIDEVWEDRPALSEKPAFSWKKSIPEKAPHPSSKECVKR